MAADLESVPNPPYVIVGNETKVACDRAIELLKQDSDAVIVATAGNASIEYRHAWMAEVMKNYLVSRGIDRKKIIIGQGKRFNTDGEMRALAYILRSEFASFPKPTTIILCVKWWHAPRARWLCWYRLKRRDISAKIKVSACPSKFSLGTLAYELAAHAVNALRIAKEIILKK